MIRFFLVQHQKLAREGLRALLEREADVAVVGEAGTPEEAAPLVAGVQPEVVMLDLDMPGLHACATVREIRQVVPEAQFVALSSRRSDAEIACALEAGILGYVLAQDGIAALSDAIHAAWRREYHYTKPVMERVVAEEGEVQPQTGGRTRLQLLTVRERQLLRLLASGMSLKNACKSLHVSYKTADKHKVNLMKKLDIHDRVELARFAIREHLIEP